MVPASGFDWVVEAVTEEAELMVAVGDETVAGKDTHSLGGATIPLRSREIWATIPLLVKQGKSRLMLSSCNCLVLIRLEIM